jgi:hypothetical protein
MSICTLPNIPIKRNMMLIVRKIRIKILFFLDTYNFYIERIKQKRNEWFILYSYFKFCRINSCKTVEISLILTTKVTSLVKEFK